MLICAAPHADYSLDLHSLLQLFSPKGLRTIGSTEDWFTILEETGIVIPKSKTGSESLIR